MIIKGFIDQTQVAASTPFDNTGSNFTSDNVQDALLELSNSPLGSVSTLVYTELAVASNEWLDYQANSVNSDQTHAILPYSGKLFAVTAANETIGKETNLEIQKSAAGAGTTTTRVAVFQCRAFRTVRFANFTPIAFNAGDKIGVYVDTTGLASPPSNFIVTLYFQVTAYTGSNTKENYSGNLPRQSTGGVTITHT